MPRGYGHSMEATTNFVVIAGRVFLVSEYSL